MSKLTLKPCPFCGSNDLDLMEASSGVCRLDGYYYVTCWCCGADGGKKDTRKSAKLSWNCRFKEKEDGQ